MKLRRVVCELIGKGRMGRTTDERTRAWVCQLRELERATGFNVGSSVGWVDPARVSAEAITTGDWTEVQGTVVG